MCTLLASDSADLPFGIRLPVPSFEGFAIHEGHCVHVRAGFLGLGRPGRRIVVDCRAAPRWAPSPPSTLAPGFAARLARLSQAATARAWFGSRAMARAATRSLQDGARPLEDVLVAIVGCGPGLTPAGDDVLVGILAVLNSPLAGDAGAQAVQAMRRAVERARSEDDCAERTHAPPGCTRTAGPHAARPRRRARRRDDVRARARDAQHRGDWRNLRGGRLHGRPRGGGGVSAARYVRGAA